MEKNYLTVVVINDFDYVQGGASKVAIQTANILASNDIKTYFFSGVTANDDSLNEKVIKISTNQNEALNDKNKIRGMINGLYNFKAKKELKNLLKNLNPQNTIIHVHGWTKCLSSSILDIAFKMKFKVVLTLHDYFSACPNGGLFNYKTNELCYLKPLSLNCVRCNCDSRNYFFKLYRIMRQFIQNKVVKLNNKLEFAISISDLSERLLKNNFKNVKMYRIYNPIEMNKNTTKINILQNEYFLYVGRVAKEKGVETFCNVMTDLNLHGIVVGNGPEYNNLKVRYPKVDFVGWKSATEVEKYMQGAKALIFPSRWYETAGLTILEALNVGIPVFVSEWCAGKEFIDIGVNGNTFRSEDDLKRKLKEYGKYNNFHYENKYTMKAYFENLVKAYYSII
ncbi:MAG: glycosyltransferase family 4 protein [Clostridia bacterium]|nr:glycosyltransferase family 4 protein [Clostridia bacterium]